MIYAANKVLHRGTKNALVSYHEKHRLDDIDPEKRYKPDHIWGVKHKGTGSENRGKRASKSRVRDK